MTANKRVLEENNKITDTSYESDDLSTHAMINKELKMDICDESDSYDQMQDEGFKLNTYTTNMDFSSLWEKQKFPALQIGDAIPTPVRSVEEANFPPSLLKILKSIKFFGPSCIQSVVWPAVMRHRNIVTIAPPHSGKSVSYLLPLASHFHSQAYEDLPSGVGPIAIILCSSWKVIQHIYELCRIFLQNAPVKIVTLYADGKSYRHKITRIINGCDIIIATPQILLQTIKDKSVDFSRCCHFILDDGDKLIAYHKTEVKDILLSFITEVKEKHFENVPILILCAETWNKTFAYIYKTLMATPLLYFTSFLESAVFAQVPFITHVCNPSERKARLLSILENTSTVICTTNADEALDVHNFLSCESIRTHVVTEQMEQYSSLERIKDWNSISSTVSPNCLVITDAALILMPISKANCLIHYDVPDDSKLQFGNRFSCIAGHFLEKDEEMHCSCHILMTKSCPAQATSLINIIKRSCGLIPESLKVIADRSKEEKKPKSALCRYLKAFGSCKEKHCLQRHTIDSISDAPSVVPKEGDIQALVTHVIDAGHYFIRLLKYLLPNSKDTKCLSATYAKIGFQLKEFYSLETNKVVIKSFVIGETYVLEDQSLFYRVKVLDIKTSKYNQEIQLLYIDEGWVKMLSNQKMYCLQDLVDLPPPLVVEVYLCNVITPDSCFDWNPQANNYISSLINGKEIYGKIMLCLGDTLWLHPIALRKKLSFLNEYLNIEKISRALIDHGYAKHNRDHLHLLLAACEGKVTVPQVIISDLKMSEEATVEPPEINYAFLECDVLEDVYVSCVNSPHVLYVQRAKFVECLDNLLDKINKGVKNKLYTRSQNVHLGMHCIAPFEDEKFYRALVTGVEAGSDDVHLFYVDFGDTGVASKSEIFNISPELLLLPFQAIECELFGISPTHGGWSEETINYLSDLTRDDSEDMKFLQLKAYKKEPRYGCGFHYVVDIWDCGKSFAKSLVQAGLVEQSEELLPFLSSLKTSDVPIENCSKVASECETSDSMHPEDKDCEALFTCVLSKLVLQSDKYSSVENALSDAVKENQLKSESQVIITEVKSDEDVATSELESKLSSCTLENDATQDLSEKGTEVKSMQNHPFFSKILQRFKHLEPKRPLILWWDTVTELHVAFQVSDIKTYDLELSDHGFKFQTSVENARYSAEEQFYSSIVSEKSTEHLSAQSLNLILHKQENARWPRLIKKPEKSLHIKYDLNHLEDSESEENAVLNAVDIAPVNGAHSKQNCDIAHYASDESHESSTDEDEKYIEPWRKIAEYKDPYGSID